MLTLLAGCGLYVGIDRFAYLPEGLPETIDAIDIVPPEQIKTVVGGALVSCLGPFAPLAGLIPGAVTILSSYIITKNKKKGK